MCITMSAPAWEQVQTLQRRDVPRAAGAAGRHSHAGAWEREKEIIKECMPDWLEAFERYMEG